ncbi:MAG: hypothetical protein HFI64_11640 [Lachnospiraceae bacterium]|nr:hypothetical protein [Lachnospiraceae bacterium]
MKKTLTELFDECSPGELDALLPEKLDVPIENDALERIRKKALEQAFPRAARLKRPFSGRSRPKGPGRFRSKPPRSGHSHTQLWFKGAAAACLVLAAGLLGFSYVSEAREYRAALQFFEENGLSAEGLDRKDVKSVYRDITTGQFTYDKTAQVLEKSVTGQVPGKEIFQREPTPEELATLWDRRNRELPESGVSYQIHYTEKTDEDRGFEVHDKSTLERYEDGVLVWAAEFSDFQVTDFAQVSDGTAVWGHTPTWSSEQPSSGWVAKVDEGGTVLWEREMGHGFCRESVSAILDNGDGTWAVISRGDLAYLCLSQYSDTGEELSFRKTEVGNYGIWNAARLEDGYLIQLGNNMSGEFASLAKLDRDGTLSGSFTYTGDDCHYHLRDMTEYNGRVYLSAYATPKESGDDSDNSIYSELSGIMDHLFDNRLFDISSEELTPMIRENYTAVLLVCPPGGGAPETFYEMKGSLGAELAVNEEGELLWNTERISSDFFFSPATSSFSIGGTCRVFRYTFDEDGALVRQEDTGETVRFYR